VDRNLSAEPDLNRPFSVEQPGKVWRVLEGNTDLFLVELRDGEPAGARHHVIRIPQGQAIFGFEPVPASGVGLLANPAPGARIAATTVEEFLEAKASPEGGSLRLFEQWIEALASIGLESHPPSQFRKLEPGVPVVTEGSPAVVLSTEGVVWIRQGRGHSAFLGNDELGRIGPGELFPVTRSGWVLASPDSQMEAFGAGHPPPMDACRRAVPKFQSVMFASLCWRHREREDQARLRFNAQADANEAVVDTALRKLAAPLTGQAAVTMEPQAGVQDPLLLACQAVGQAMNLDIRPMPKTLDKSSARDPVASIAQASRLRYRQVILRGRWWRQEGSAVVGFLGEQKKPVALLPGPRSRFSMYDPATRLRTPITADIASQINAVAYVFYRPFPDRAMGFRSVIRFGLEHCRPELLMIGLMCLALAMLALVAPVLTGIIFDTVIPGAQRGTLAEFTLFLVATAVAIAMLSLTQRLATLRLEGKMDAAIQSAIWDRLLAFPVPFFRQFTAGDLARRSLGISQIRQTLTGPVLTSVLSGIFSLSSLALMFYYSWRLALIGSVLVGFSFVVFVSLGYVQVQYLRGATEIGGQLSGMTLQFINGVNKFRVSGAEVRAFAVWAQKFAQQKRLVVRVNSLAGYLEVFNSAFPVISTAVIFYFAAQWMRTPGLQAMTTGEFLAFDAAFIQLSAAMMNLSAAATATLSIVPLYERAKPILQARSEVQAGGIEPGELSGGIEVNHLHFRYRGDGPQVLRDLSVTIRPGQFVAFVGPSGSGKSTLFRLLLGFERPESGAIYYDGQSLADLDVREVRRQMGVVIQNGRLLTGDIYRNIVGSSALTVEDAWEAARMAGLDEDIQAMPMGMHTLVSESGGLSGGQRQRLMIARAIVRLPRIVLLDEATSALDNQTQAIVSRSLQRLNATRVVIAHRLSTVQHADAIYVLEKGVLVESGTYEELMAHNGLFSSLARRQLT
jgi:NHLM bacteriocin system ABC transporter ATP-binding protein